MSIHRILSFLILSIMPVPHTNPETSKAIKDKLAELKAAGKWIALSLHPESGSTIVSGPMNRLFINEGRDGKYEGVTEVLYDSMVDKYDSRYQK